MSAIRAKKNVPAGSPISKSNEFWEVDASISPTRAAKRWTSIRMMRVLEIAEEVFDDDYADRVMPMFMGQQDLGNVRIDLDQQFHFHPGLMPQVMRCKSRGTGVAWYFNTMRNMPTDGTVPELIQRIGDSFDESFEETVRLLRAVAADALRYGFIPSSYEGLDHSNYTEYRKYGNYQKAWDAYQASDRGRLHKIKIIKALNAVWPGLACCYVMYGEAWGLKLHMLDHNNNRSLGVRQGMAAIA